MFEKLLQDAGLTQNEAKIYECLLTLNTANISTIATKSKVHRRNVYDCLTKLIDKGLISQQVLENQKQFKAVNPRRLIDLQKDKERLLSDELPKLQSLYHKVPNKEQSFIYKGISGYKNYMQDILDTCEEGEIIYIINGKGGWWDPKFEPYRKRFYDEFKKKKIIARHLLDWDMKRKNPELVKLHKHRKFLPKKFATNSAIDIFADRVVSYTGLDYNKLEDDITLFVMISKPMAESYKNWFRMIWDLLPSEN